VTDASPDNLTTPAVPRSPMGRRITAVTMTVLTGMLIWFGAGVLHREVYAERAPNPIDRACLPGLRRLHVAYEAAWVRQREGATTPEVVALDGDLRGLRGLCAREGGASQAAFDHLERWRYRAEDQVRLWREAVGDEAGRALGNQGIPHE
jgi:hypothetical protein